jgi:hypothetical protein
MFQGAEGLGRMGEFAQRAGLTDAAAMEAIGAQRQGMDQASLDLAYQDFLEQRELPFERLGFMSNIIRGIPYSRATQRTDVGPASVYQPSPLSQIIGGYGVYRGLNPRETAEGGYIEGDYEDVSEYGEGGYVDPKGYAEGGLTSFFQRYMPTFSKWAAALRPSIGQGVGAEEKFRDPPGGKFLKLEHKQD